MQKQRESVSYQRLGHQNDKQLLWLDADSFGCCMKVFGLRVFAVPVTMRSSKVISAEWFVYDENRKEIYSASK